MGLLAIVEQIITMTSNPYCVWANAEYGRDGKILPEKKPEEAFKKLDSLDEKFGFLSDKLKIIDLRVKDRMIIKLNVGNFTFRESNV